MTWAQTLAIVAPILVAIVGGVFYNSRQIDQLAHQLGDRIDDLRTDVNARFGSVDGRFGGMEARFSTMEARFSGMEALFTAMETRIESRFAEVHQDLVELRGLLHDALRPKAS